jgi:CPA2 family monovalent cation:H+ antiporter-2
MAHDDLIVTLVAAFVAAFAGGFVAARLSLPPIVGYILAGVAIGPYTPGGSASPEVIEQLAEVGVILLMFGVGLHFSIREMLDVSPIALPGAVGQSAIATLLGLGVSLLWGWPVGDGIVFGLCLSVASTIVMLRALEERNLLDTHPGHLAVGWLIVEDLVAVLILVLLPAFSASGEIEAGLASALAGDNQALVILFALTQAAVFVALMLYAGRKLVPRLLTEVVRAGSRELFTLCILALALGVAFGSSELFGASLALGAFLAGVVLNESELSHRAGLEALPLRDAFAVLFFVSVGMLFDPAILTEQPFHILAVVAIIMLGKAAAAFIIVTGIGYGVRTALIVSAALAQVGEFSFILSGLGFSLGVLPEEGTSLILAGAILSITLNPFIFRNIDLAEGWLARWPSFNRLANRRAPISEAEIAVRRHVVICGFGQTGSSLARTLSGRGLPFVIVENDPFVFDRARAAGFTAVFGDATQTAVLEQARVSEARTLAVTFANQPDAPLTVQNARRLNPDIDAVARGSGPDTHRLLRQAGASEVVDPEFEASLEFVRHVLHRYGVDGREIAALQSRRRAEHYRPQ